MPIRRTEFWTETVTGKRVLVVRVATMRAAEYLDGTMGKLEEISAYLRTADNRAVIRRSATEFELVDTGETLVMVD